MEYELQGPRLNRVDVIDFATRYLEDRLGKDRPGCVDLVRVSPNTMFDLLPCLVEGFCHTLECLGAETRRPQQRVYLHPVTLSSSATFR